MIQLNTSLQHSQSILFQLVQKAIYRQKKLQPGNAAARCCWETFNECLRQTFAQRSIAWMKSGSVPQQLLRQLQQVPQLVYAVVI
jgi:hypothetical protein